MMKAYRQPLKPLIAILGLLVMGNLSVPSFHASALTYQEISGGQTTGQVLGTATGWFNPPTGGSWQYRKAITIDHTKVSPVTGTTLTNFPVLISVTDTNLKLSAQVTGNDLLFTSSDGLTKLSHEIESYNPATGNLVAWVNVPALSPSADTTLYIYYGNPTASNQQNRTGVWDGNYKAVYHLPDGAALSANDSTANANNSTNTGVDATAGQVGGGALFNSTGDQLALAPITFAGPFTISSWVNISSMSVARVFWGAGSSATNKVGGGVTAGQFFVRVISGGSSDQTVALPGSAAWAYVSLTRNASNKVDLYVNGSPNRLFSDVAQIGSSAWGMLGKDMSGGSQNFLGSMDEVRLSAVDRSADWVKTEYNNQTSPASFYAVGAAESQGGGSPAPSPVINSFDASPTSITAGNSATLTWNTSNAVSVSITPGSFTSAAASGSTTVNPTSSTTYTLTASNSAGSAVASATVTVSGTPPGDTSPPVLSNVQYSNLTASGATITWTTNESSDSQVEYGTTNSYGQSSLLNSTLTASHVVSLTGLSAATPYHFRVKSKDAAGNLAVSADGAFTTAAASVVSVAPSITSFSANPTAVNAGSSAVLSWAVANATVVNLDGVGDVTGRTSVVVTPAVTTTYTLTASNGMDSATSALTITVNGGTSSPNPGASYNPTDYNPDLDQYGGSTKLKCASATGGFHTEKISDRWWICDPLGNAEFLTSLGGAGVEADSCDPSTGQCMRYSTIATQKYGNTNSAWGPQQNRRLVSWGFNSDGQISTGWVYPTQTCPNCAGWPNGEQPIKLPMYNTLTVSNYASANLWNYSSQPTKDIMFGLNKNYTGWRAAITDYYDGNFSQWMDNYFHLSSGVQTYLHSPWVVGFLIDDTDWFWGVGAGVEFHTVPAGTNTAHLGYMVAIASPTQTFNYNPGSRSIPLLYTDTKVYAKAASSNPPASCSIATPCSLRDYLFKKYNGNINALNASWGSNYTTFDSSGTQINSEVIGTGDGAKTTFTATLSHASVSPLSLLVKLGGSAVGGDCPYWNTGCAVTSGGSIRGPAGSPILYGTQPWLSANTWQDCSTSGCTMPAANYWIKINYHMKPGFAATPSREISDGKATGGFQLVVPSPAANANATGWDVYVSCMNRTTGGVSWCTPNGTYNNGQETLQASNIPFGTSWVEPLTGLVVGSPVPPPASYIDYGSGTIAVTFATPPAAGTPITADYMAGGWMYGSGFLDEDGRHTSWMGTNPTCLSPAVACDGIDNKVPNAAPGVAADLNPWIAQFSAQYFKTVRAEVKKAAPDKLYMGADTIGTWGTPPRKEILQGAAPYIDLAFTSIYTDRPDPTTAQAMFQFFSQYIGDKPIIDFIALEANADSAVWRYTHVHPSFPPQDLRGQKYLTYMTDLLNWKNYYGTYPWVGTSWWGLNDFWNEKYNWGLVSLNDNPYDGTSDTIAAGRDAWNFATGGEEKNYGDAITGVKAANKLWYPYANIAADSITFPVVPLSSATSSPTGNVPAISSFTATPSAVASGSAVTLAWVQTGATSLSINQGVGTVSGSSKVVFPSVTTTYTLTATNSNGFSTKTVTVAVSGGADIVAPAISTIASTTTATTAQIKWQTDELADSQVDYGLNAAYGQSTAVADVTTKVLSHTVNLTALSAGTTYHFRLKSKDAAGNLAATGDFTFMTGQAATTDITPPAAVANLASAGVTQSSAVLTFTAPGNDGNSGTAEGYTVRYATAPLTAGNFNAAALATGLPSPAVAGTNQSYTLVGLSANTTYYVALKTSDSAGNVSPLSNIATFTTLPASTQPGPGGGGGGGGGSIPSIPVISNTKADALDSQVSLSWTNPIDVTFVRVLVVRKEGSAATSSLDGIKIYEGTATSFIDTNLTNGKTYFYSFYPILLSGVSASPSQTQSAVPRAGATQISTANPENPNRSISNLKLINLSGTYYLIINNIRHGITNPGMLYSYGFSLSDAKPATDSDKALPEGDLLLPGDGALVKSAQDKTVYLISQGQRYSFTSAPVFLGLGFKWTSVLVVTNPELQALPKAASLISDPKVPHLPGLDINRQGTVYWIGDDNQLHGYPSLQVYNSWHIHNDFIRVVPANAADNSLPVGGLVGERILN